jgi:hypothetical protein
MDNISPQKLSELIPNQPTLKGQPQRHANGMPTSFRTFLAATPTTLHASATTNPANGAKWTHPKRVSRKFTPSSATSRMSTQTKPRVLSAKLAESVPARSITARQKVTEWRAAIPRCRYRVRGEDQSPKHKRRIIREQQMALKSQRQLLEASFRSEKAKHRRS